MPSPRVSTIADIARIAGVSKSTVSRALNDSPLIGPDTKERIREIAREHQFQMNDSARRLSLRQSNVVALVTYAYKADVKVPDTFMLEMMSGISAGLHADGYDLLVIQVSPKDTDWVRRYRDSGRVDGFVLLGGSCTQEHIRTLTEARAPFVIWGLVPANHEYCSVSGDSFAGGRTATEHLLRSGRKHVAFLGGPVRWLEVQDRFKGYAAALHDAGIAADERLVEYVEHYGAASGGNAMRVLLERGDELDGVFVNSDVMAIAAMDEIRAHGRSVPDGRRRLRRHFDRRPQRSAAHHDQPKRPARRPAARGEPDPAPADRRGDERLDPGGARRPAIRLSEPLFLTALATGCTRFPPPDQSDKPPASFKGAPHVPNAHLDPGSPPSAARGTADL
jgi:DNA-binding LacI/PurR family transcriptional regulator